MPVEPLTTPGADAITSSLGEAVGMQIVENI